MPDSAQAAGDVHPRRFSEILLAPPYTPGPGESPASFFRLFIPLNYFIFEDGKSTVALGAPFPGLHVGMAEDLQLESGTETDTTEGSSARSGQEEEEEVNGRLC